MAETSFNTFFNQPFGLNVKVPERTMQQAGQTLSNTAGGVLSPLFEFLEENETVFSGDIQKEIIKYNIANFNIGSKLREEDIKVNGQAPRFDSKF